MGVSMIIFTVVTGFFAIRGYFNGFARSCAKTLSILGAYIAAFFLAKPASALLGDYVSLKGVMLYLTAGSAVFIIVMLLIRLLFWLILGSKNDDEELSTKSRLGGVAMGALIGAFIGILLVYTWGIYTTASNRDSTVSTPKTEPAIEHAAKVIVSKTAGSILALTGVNETTAKIGEAFLASPVESADRISRVTNNADLQGLLNDSRTQRLMRAGDVDELLKVPAFTRLMSNDDMRALMQSSGFDIDSDADIRTTAKKLTAGYQSFQLAKDDPRVKNILSDPEFQTQLRAKNKLPLLFNPDLNTLANIIFVEGAENIESLEKETATIDYVDGETGMQEENKDSTTVYRNKSKDGEVIYSDRPVN